MAPIRLLVCEDNDLWVRVVEGSPESASFANSVVLVDDPCRTASEALELIEQTAPDVVLLDNTIPWTHGRTKEKWGIRLVAEVARRSGRERPLCILWTSEPHELDEYAFCQFGGHNVADKSHERHIEHTFETIVGTVNGTRRVFAPPQIENPHDHESILKHAAVLPALEAAMTDEEASRWLTGNGIKKLNPGSVSDYVSRLGIALGLKGQGNRRRIWEEAYERGYRWIRVEHETWNPARRRPPD